MLDTVVMSGDDVCCSVVFGTLVGMFVFSVMWSELLMTFAISCPLWSSVYECQRVECAFTSPVRTECGMLHPHTHHIVAPGFVDRPRRSDCTAGQIDGEAGWWTTNGNIGLPPLARVMGVGRQQQHPPPALCNLMVRTDVKLCIFGVLALGVSLVS